MIRKERLETAVCLWWIDLPNLKGVDLRTVWQKGQKPTSEKDLPR